MNSSQYKKKQLLEKMSAQRKVASQVAHEVVNKPVSEVSSVDLVIGKIKKLTPDGTIVNALDFSALPNVNGNFLEELILRLTSIETLLNSVNDKLNVFTASD